MWERSGQPERFEAGGMDMDPAFDAVLQPDLGDPGLPDAGGLAAPEELPMDPLGPAADAMGTPGPLPGAFAEPEDERAAQVDGAEVAGAAAQARVFTCWRHIAAFGCTTSAHARLEHALPCVCTPSVSCPATMSFFLYTFMRFGCKLQPVLSARADMCHNRMSSRTA